MATKGSLKMGGDPSLSGIWTFGPHPCLLAGGALAKRRLSRSYAAEAAILFPLTTYKSKLLTAVVENKISIAFAMLTP